MTLKCKKVHRILLYCMRDSACVYAFVFYYTMFVYIKGKGKDIALPGVSTAYKNVKYQEKFLNFI